MWSWLQRLFSRKTAAHEPQVWHFRIRGERREIGAVNDALERAAMAGEVPEMAMRQMQVALDELLTNAITHGRVSASEPMEVDLIVESRALRAVVRHAGVQFDPTRVEGADTTSSIEDRAIGGLGLHLVRETMDEFTYQYIEGRNILRVGKKF